MGHKAMDPRMAMLTGFPTFFLLNLDRPSLKHMQVLRELS